MNLPRGRLFRAPTNVVAVDMTTAAATYARGVRLERDVVEATERAAQLLKAAERRAATILETAERAAADVQRRAEEVGRAEGLAAVAAHSMRQRNREARADEEAIDRVVALSALLAERILGRVLATAPMEIASLARELVAEARGARRIAIHAHAEDVAALSTATRDFDPDGRVHSIVSDPSLGRGDIRLETEIGTIDGRLGPEIARLAVRLREALRP